VKSLRFFQGLSFELQTTLAEHLVWKRRPLDFTIKGLQDPPFPDVLCVTSRVCACMVYGHGIIPFLLRRVQA
jgi:hypothetical protein